MKDLDRPLSAVLIGVDEVGRGPWAGPVCAGAVVLGPDHGIEGLNDSKRLSARRRQALAPEIEQRARAWGLGWASAEEIDATNILRATFQAMQRAVVKCLEMLADCSAGTLAHRSEDGSAAGLKGSSAVTLQDSSAASLVDRFTGNAWGTVFIQVDGSLLPARSLGPQHWPWATQAVVGGDAQVAEISAASILAKVARDGEMARLDAVYPGYGFAQHAGYGTAVHQAALDRLGPCPVHRRSFAPVARCLARQLPSRA
nr:Ribonuclease HII [Cupriavidus sp.]